MKTELDPIFRFVTDRFRRSVDLVFELVRFDRVILGLCIAQLESLKKDTQIKMNPLSQGALENRLTMLRNIQTNNSLKHQYEVIYDQALVLLVSHFASALGDLFRKCVGVKIQKGLSDTLDKEAVKITLGELRDLDVSSPDYLGDLVVRSNGTSISFQDMNSIHRAFEEYLGANIPKDKTVNNLIVAQACRNTIVHDGGLVNDRVKRQIKGAVLRDLKLGLETESVVHISESELKLVADEMERYLKTLANEILQNNAN